ncbi:MAG: tyrosine-protein kinase domain-containing protein [Actinomycetota bacterium]
MELHDYIRVVWRRKWIIALVFAVCAGGAIFISSRSQPVYSATAKVFIGPRTTRATDAAIQELTFSGDYVSSYAELLHSRPLAERTIERLQIPEAPQTVVGNLTTRVVLNTRIIEVTLTDTDATRAALIVNTLTDTFVNEIQQDYGGKFGVQATVFEPAVKPGGPISPNPGRDGILGGLLGLMLGVGLAVVLEQADTRIRDREQIESKLAPYPVLAEVPKFEAAGHGEFFVLKDPKSPAAEAFRILRTNVQFLAVDQPISRIIVTSPYVADGKTTVSANLSAALAAAGFSTILMESDLRRPTVHEYLGTQSESPGITDVLLGRRTLREAMRTTAAPQLQIVPSGPLPPNPSELLGSQRMVELLEEASSIADVVVLDSPPILPVTDAAALAPRCDGVILVVRAGRTHLERAREALAQFERVGVRVLGIVLNGVEKAGSSYYYYSGYYYSEPKSGKRSSKDSKTFVPPEPKPSEWSSAATNGHSSNGESKPEPKFNELRLDESQEVPTPPPPPSIEAPRTLE